MKSKLDFVTNSSSTSFVVWGISMDKHEFTQRLNDTAPSLVVGDGDDIDYYETFEKLTSELEDITSTTPYGYDGDEIMIGSCPSNMKEDETLKEFKQRIAAQLNKAGIDVNSDSIKLIEACWMDN